MGKEKEKGDEVSGMRGRYVERKEKEKGEKKRRDSD